MPKSFSRTALLFGSSLIALTILADPIAAKGKGNGLGHSVGNALGNVLHSNSGKGGNSSDRGTAGGIGGGGGIAGGGGGTGAGVGSDLGQAIGRGLEDKTKHISLGGGGETKSGRPNLLQLVRPGPSQPSRPTLTSASASSSQGTSSSSEQTSSNATGGGGGSADPQWDPFVSQDSGSGGGAPAPNVQHLNLAEIAAATANAAGQVSEDSETDAGAAEASYQAAKATLTVVRETHFAMTEPQGQYADQHMKSAHEAADQARRYAEEAVRIVLKAWPQWPSVQAQSAAAYAQRSADAAAVEVSVADNMMATYKATPRVATNKLATPPKIEAKVELAKADTTARIDAGKAEKSETTAFATAPTPQRKPAPPPSTMVASAATPMAAPPQPKSKEAESYEMVAAKANADAQIALIAATTATTKWDAQDNAMAALRASMIAKQAADAAGEAFLRTQVEARKSIDSVEAQADAEMASRASQKAFLHAKAAAAAANRAYALTGGGGEASTVGASPGVQ